MKRRAFARMALLGGTSAAVVPSWIERAFGQQCGLGTASLEVSHAFQRAHRRGKPLLVLVVPPADDGRVWDRGYAFGELINHGPNETLALLSLAEVVAAPLDALRQLVPQAPAEGTPWMILVETDRVPAEVSALDGEIPTVPDFPSPTEQYDAFDARCDRIITQRIERLTAMLRSALSADAVMLRRRAAQASGRLTERERSELSIDADVELVDRGAALLWSTDAATLGALAQASRHRLVEGRVPGAPWAHSGGCGVTIEEPDPDQARWAVACGMGHVPERSQRFLYFITRDPITL